MGLELVSPPYFVHNFLRKIFLILLTDQMSLSDCSYSLRYWAIYVLQLLVSQSMTLQTLELTLACLSSRNKVSAFKVK